MYVIGLNGPPRSGKDTMADLLIRELDDKTTQPVIRIPLSMPMRQMTFGALGMSYSVQTYERIKDQPIAALNGSTLRQFMIDVSEKFMKPTYGQRIWLRLLVEALPLVRQSGPGILIIPDIGFQHEIDFLSEYFGPHNVALIQMRREGHTFQGDSREYVESPNQFTFTIHNNHDMENLTAAASHIIRNLQKPDRGFGTEGWKL